MEESKDASVLQRLQAVERRLDLAGRPLVLPPPDRWIGGPAPDPAALRGKVVVWHVYAWWMEARSGELDDWKARLSDSAAKDLVVLPLTRTGGWDPGTGKFDPAARKPDAEAADIGKSLEARGWKGAAGVYHGDGGFAALRVRGLPMEIVVARDGTVRFVQAGSDAGHALAIRAAARALEEPPPAAAPPPPVPPAAPPAKDAPAPGEVKDG